MSAITPREQLHRLEQRRNRLLHRLNFPANALAQSHDPHATTLMTPKEREFWVTYDTQFLPLLAEMAELRRQIYGSSAVQLRRRHYVGVRDIVDGQKL
jgi:hypothetical protein